MSVTNIVGLGIFAAIVIFFIAKSKIKRNNALTKLASDMGGEYVNSIAKIWAPAYVRLTGKGGGETKIIFTAAMQALTLEMAASSRFKLLIDKKLGVADIILGMFRPGKGTALIVLKDYIKMRNMDKVQIGDSAFNDYKLLTNNSIQAGAFIKDPNKLQALKYFANLDFTEIHVEENCVNVNKSKYGLENFTADKIKQHLTELEKLSA